ncbi:HAD-IA family hydrolase [Pseudodesulfovibrio sp. JC047]|uniref:HAD family hydrolase n=1 Tax=Pseudodesulfovibrio sp. JC047 TaxID=2683199 RepID=UPI0013D1506E|nr:HAD family phosphatase [Pseudodesulfovibrio sp. JC047]NDV18681.1 HAD-IA family hydrolase [Pseudodesulfovibrio sp. JC047]
MNMKYPGAVLFDMDGVIFDSEPIHERIFIEYAAELGFVCPPEEYRHLIGTSSVTQWRLMKEKHHLPDAPQALSDEKMAHYKTFLAASSGLRPISGIPTLLNDLTMHDIPFALASSNTTDVIEATLKAIGLHTVITTIVGGNDVPQAKPAPDIFLLAAKKLKVPPKDCLVIEDSTNGILAARRAGMRSLGFNNPNSPGQQLHTADFECSSLEGLTVNELCHIFTHPPK